MTGQRLTIDPEDSSMLLVNAGFQIDGRFIFIQVHAAEAALNAAESSLSLADARIAALAARMSALEAIAIALDAISVPQIAPSPEPPPIDDLTRARARRILSRGGFVRTT
jgi:hypothetical protein